MSGDISVNTCLSRSVDNRVRMAVSKPPKPWTVFQERLFLAMAKEGLYTPADLARKLDVSPQTAYKWWAGRTENLRAADVLRISDKLDVGFRWLLGERGEMQKGFRLSTEEQRALEVYRALSRAGNGWADHWISQGNDILKRLPAIPPSLSHPFPVNKKTPQK
jgi:transcriptional regulator with XRE-family HTH domain